MEKNNALVTELLDCAATLDILQRALYQSSSICDSKDDDIEAFANAASVAFNVYERINKCIEVLQG